MQISQRDIHSLLEDIERGDIALPEVQREFVWSDNDAKDLLDSLYKKYPVGYIFLWRPKEVKPYRYFEGQTQLTNYMGIKREPVWYLLDGQQRLTSLLKIKKGDIKIYFNIDREEFHLENRAIKSDPTWIYVTEVWREGPNNILRKLKEKLGISLEDIWEKYMTRISNLYSVLEEELPVYELQEDNYSKITEIYMRLNSKGVRLKKAELVMAMAVLNIPKEFRSNLEKLHDEFEDWDFDVNFYMRCLTCMITEQSKFEYLKSYLNTDKDKVLRIMNDLHKYMDITLKLLNTHLGLTSAKVQTILPSEIVLIPLLMYIYNNRDKGIKNDSELNKLLYWFLMASFWGRYSGATESKLDEDLKALKDPNPIDRWIQNILKEKGRLKVDIRDFEGRFTKNKLLLLYFLVHMNKAMDWFSATDLTNTDTVELHHVFPKKVLKDKGDITDEQINDIRNIVFISAKANRRISSKEPRDYFKSENIDKNRLNAQLIPLDDDLHRKEAYNEFLKKRGELIVNSLNNVLANMYKGHSSSLS
ncbi:MAG: DUF262 domain-containing protein [Candidatus Anstonellales archaeon]